LTEAGSEHRYWYGAGLHREKYFAEATRDALPVIESLAARLIGLPTAPDLTSSEINRIVASIARGRDHAGE
jgi:dTDP-4-amino-4,6-dideoxygalactose transaminase